MVTDILVIDRYKCCLCKNNLHKQHSLQSLFIIAVMASYKSVKRTLWIRSGRRRERTVYSRAVTFLVERLMVSPRMSTAAQVEALLNKVEIVKGNGRNCSKR